MLGVKSSIFNSPCSGKICVFLSSPYFSLSSSNSSFIRARTLFLSARIASYSAIFLIKSSYSALILSCSRPVKRLNCISKIAFACSVSSPNLDIKPFLASSVFLDFLISSITSSSAFKAIIKPSKICARAFAFFKKKIVLLVITSTLCSMNSFSTSYKLSNLGCWPTRATIFTPKLVISAVCLYKLFLTTSGLASRFSSITTLMPSRSDSSRISEMP